MGIAPAFHIAGGIILGRAGIRALGLEGLGATPEQCEQWRRIASWAVPATDEERRDAAAKYNAECRQATDGLSESQQAAVWLRRHPIPKPENYPAWVLPAPVCGPLDGACLECSRRVLDYNRVAIENARRRYRRDLCIWNCYRQRAAGHPELCRDCRQYEELPLPAQPACGGALVRAVQTGGDYQIPTADWVAAEPEKFRSQDMAERTTAAEPAPGAVTQPESGDASPAQSVPAGAAPAPFSPPLPDAVHRIVERLPEPVQANPWPWLAGAAIVVALLISRGGAA